MRIEPATCPACGAEYDPLRARAVTVIDGHVRAFCSPACRERGLAPAPSAAPRNTTDAHAVIPARRAFWATLPTEYLVLMAAAAAALVAFVVLIRAGRHERPSEVPAIAVGAASSPAKPAAAAGAEDAAGDRWLKPLAGGSHRISGHDRTLFSAAREGVPAAECAGARCAVDFDAAPGDVVMVVHDGVVERVEEDPDFAGRRGREGRFVRVVHKGGTLATTYFQLDGIREDLRPGIPLTVGEPIGTVARPPAGGHAHLRFAVSLPHAEGGEIFIDPQPLLALWPARPHSSASLHAMDPAPPRPERRPPPAADAE